jgi:hypothetical protein
MIRAWLFLCSEGHPELSVSTQIKSDCRSLHLFCTCSLHFAHGSLPVTRAPGKSLARQVLRSRTASTKKLNVPPPPSLL